MLHHDRTRKLDDIYADPTLYRSSQNLLPPSEKLPHVLRLELTSGCSWGHCTYCSGFDQLRYEVKTEQEFEAHTTAVMARVGCNNLLASTLTRLFIGGGNALSVPTPSLTRAIQIASDAFRARSTFGKPAERIAIYGTTRDILMHGTDGLEQLFRASFNGGLDLIYWGIESGSSTVLKYVKKGDSKTRLLEAAAVANTSRIQTSVMIMPGLGGMRLYDEHVQDTADVLSVLSPRYITFLGINPGNTLYDLRMSADEAKGTNRPLTASELSQQMIDIIDTMRLMSSTKFGCFNTHIDKVGNNPLSFGSQLINTWRQKDYFVAALRDIHNTKFS